MSNEASLKVPHDPRWVAIPPTGKVGMKVAEVALRMYFCGTELAGLETWLSRQAGVHHAATDRTRALLHVGYDPAVTDPERLRSLLDSRGYGCDCEE